MNKNNISFPIAVDKKSDFSLDNIPFGIFSDVNPSKRVCTAIGNWVIDLAGAYEIGLFQSLPIEKNVFHAEYLNKFIELGKPITSEVRLILQKAIQDSNSLLAKTQELFYDQSSVKMHLPVKIGDYTDFYSSIEHATNVGKMFRDPENALLPNWRHLPVGYHGRASSIICSGTPIKRPMGQILPKGEKSPIQTGGRFFT